MKRLLPISLLLAALCISTAAFAQKDKVVEASSKRKPAWIGSSDRSHFAVTEVGETLAAASGKCMASIRQYIVNAVAVNVSSAEKMATRQITRDQLVTAMSDYSSALMTEAGQLPYLNDITLSNAEAVYWERIYSKKTKTYRYEYSVLYPFPEQTRRQLIEAFVAIDDAKQAEYERLRRELGTITDIDRIRLAVNELDGLYDYFFDATRKGDVETLRRAPQLSGESAALQKALNNYLGGSATLKYPASGDFLSPFAFGDWDGDGTDEAAVLYTTDTTSSNVWLAVLEPTGESSWRVSRVVEGLTSEVQSFSAAHLRDTSSQQLLAGYVSPQGDQYLVVYQYDGDTLSTVISKSYTDMIVADFTGKGDTQDLVLALPPDTELGGVTLQLLTANDGEFRSTQTLNLGEGVYSSCAALHAGTGSDDGMYLVMDAWTGTSSLVSDIILYDEATGFLQPYRPSGMSDIQRSTLRYHRELLSRDLDDNGTVDIPVEIDDGGTLQTPMDKRLSFLLWKDYTSMAGGNSKFGVYDSEYNIFMELPESMHGNILIRSNQSGTGWLICNAEGTTVYCEMRVVDPADNAATGVGNYLRIANIGSQQLQARVVTSYYGLSLDFISQNTVLLGSN